MVVIVGAGMAGISTAYYLATTRTTAATSATTGSHSSSHSSLSRRIMLIDAVGGPSGATTTTINSCASGQAGAFLSKSWGDGTKRQALFQHAFPLHQELAHDLNVTSFFELPAYRLQLLEKAEAADGGDLLSDDTSNNNNHNNGDIRFPLWEEAGVTIPHQCILGPSAMVDPAELTTKMLEAAMMEEGVTFRKGSVQQLQLRVGSSSDDEVGLVQSIIFEDGSTLELEDGEPLVMAMGPWSASLEDWLDIPVPVEGVLSTSLIWEDLQEDPMSNNTALLSAAAYFCNEDVNGCHLEIFPRRQSTTTTTTGSREDGARTAAAAAASSSSSLYVSGCGGSEVWSPAVFRKTDGTAPRPHDPCPPNLARAAAAQRSLRSLVPATIRLPSDVHQRPPDRIQACLRPTTPDGMPLVGKLQGGGKGTTAATNIYLCTGGGPWGITWGPLMGLCMAQMLLKEEEEEDLSPPLLRMGPFQPSRFDTFLYRSLLKERTSRSRSDDNPPTVTSTIGSSPRSR